MPNTPTQASDAPRGWLFLLVAGFNIALFLAYGIKGAVLNFSFWIDELYSITASRMPVSEMLRIAATDVHPPTYYLVLKAWGLLAGVSELAARGLSFLFVVAAIFFFGRLRPALPKRAFQISLALFTSSYFLFFYAQEVRSYALLLLLATASYSYFLREETGRLIAASTLVGMVHFFGTLLGAIFLASVLLKRSNAALRIWALGGLAIIAVWPSAQILLGLIQDYASGGFWIETTPLGAIKLALFTSFPVFEGIVVNAEDLAGTRADVVIGLAWLLLAGFALLFAFVTYRSATLGARALRPLNQSLLVFGLVVGAAVVISLHTPVATKRNFIVLVPIVPVILGLAFHALLLERRLLRVFAVVVFLLLEAGGVLAIVYKMENKHLPWQDWRGPAQLAFDTADQSGGSAFYFENEFGSAEWLGHVFRYYFPKPDRLAPLNLSEIADPQPGDVLVFGHEICTGYAPLRNRIVDRLDTAAVPYRVVWFEQFLECPNGVVIYE